MKDIPRFHVNSPPGGAVESPNGGWCLWNDVQALLSQLPDSMKHCTILLQECDKGHHWLHATNWVDHGCPTCAREKLQEELNNVHAQALAAVWLIPDDETPFALRSLHDEARSVLMGKDKQVIAKLQDELRYAQEAYQHAQRPQVPGVNTVVGLKAANRHVAYALMITKVTHAANGGLNIEVELP